MDIRPIRTSEDHKQALPKAHMEVEGLTQADLGAVLRSAPRASEILNRKRALSMDMVYRLNKEWRLPPEALVQPYHLAARRQ